MAIKSLERKISSFLHGAFSDHFPRKSLKNGYKIARAENQLIFAGSVSRPLSTKITQKWL